MFFRQSSVFTKRTAAVIFLYFTSLGLISIGLAPEFVLASPRLPNVIREMETPGFWIKKIENPTKLLLTSEKIQRMNEENLKRQDLRLCRIKDLKESWAKGEIVSLLREDWKDFGGAEAVRYGKDGHPLGNIFWDKLRNNMSPDSMDESSRMLFALIIRQTDIRIFPTDEPSIAAPKSFEFDLLQQSSIRTGSPIGVYRFSRDKKWAYVQTQFIRGWIHTDTLAVAEKKAEVVDYEDAADRLVVTGNLVPVFADPSLRQRAFMAQMGNSFPLLATPKDGQAFYVISIPSGEEGRRLSFRNGYLRPDEDVHQGFLPYHQENIAHQAFKMLNHPYGWGDRRGGRDCSSFIMDLFNTFGILMPRNSKEQAWVGTGPGSIFGKSVKEKERLLGQSVPLATTLRLPGHIMLYLGRDGGRDYVIHNTWGVQKAGRAGPSFQKIGRVAVSDLSLGEEGPSGSLLDRLSDIRVIGSTDEAQDK
ncbi:MAG TPA: SH3 domain-containing protein [Thermodesulfobacteriota bacterium]|nr:SH3 domain-containing protein [Thermodesulfobacteriota bacterium]